MAALVAGPLLTCGGDRDDARTAKPARVSDPAPPADRDTAPAGVVPVTDSGPVVGPSRLAGPDFLDVSYRLLGTEPFWSVDMTRDGLVYTRLGADTIQFPFGELRRRPRNDEMWTSSGGHEIMARVSRRQCSDGMSDRVYRFTARVVIDGEQLDGCAFETPIAAPPAPPAAIERAGLTGLVETARRARAGKGGYERVTGEVPPVAGGVGDTATTRFAAYFAGDTLRLIEARTRVGERVTAEVTYFFEATAAEAERDVTLRLIDGDTWSAGGVHNWTVVGLAPDGTLVGDLQEIDGEPAPVSATTVAALQAIAARLTDSAYHLFEILEDAVEP